MTYHDLYTAAMPTPIGFAHLQTWILQDGDPDPYLVTYGVSTDLSTFTAAEHCEYAQSAFTTAWAARMSSQIDLLKTVGYFGQDGGPDLIAESSAAPVAGTSPGAKLPQNCALLVKKVTGFGGRKNRGRCFVPGVVSEGETTQAGVISTTELAALQLAATDWLDELTSGDGTTGPTMSMVILHSDASTPTDVSDLVCDSVIATQRRRLRR